MNYASIVEICLSTITNVDRQQRRQSHLWRQLCAAAQLTETEDSTQ